MKLSLEEICRAHKNGSLNKLIESLRIPQDEFFDVIVAEFDKMRETIMGLEDDINDLHDLHDTDWEDS